MLNRLHHISIICSNYKISKKFYTDVLGLEIIREIYRPDRESYKLDLSLNGVFVLELFSFPSPPKRKTYPEAAGLRHLAFEVFSVEKVIEELKEKDIVCEAVRIDENTGRKFTFFNDPDGLPIELYEK
jgi:glyoxylase I family protein